MLKWLVPVVVLAGLVIALLWPQRSPPSPGSGAAEQQIPAQPEPAPSPRPSPATTAAPRTTSQDAATAPVPTKLDPLGPAFTNRVDTEIPARFRVQIAKCDYQDLNPNLKIKIKYRIHAVSGEVWATNVKVSESQLNDAELEKCMVEALEQTRWRDEAMPDFEEDTELLVRLLMLRKFKNHGPDPEPRRDRNYRNDPAPDGPDRGEDNQNGEPADHESDDGQNEPEGN